MRIDHAFPWRRIAQTLETAPIIIEDLLRRISDAELDFRPDPERMTIREVIAHLAGWEPVALRHLRLTCAEDVPLLDDCEHDVLPPSSSIGIDMDLATFTERRLETVAFLRTLSVEDWNREAIRSTYGPTTLDAQAFIIVMHDTYHVRQIVEWKNLFAQRHPV